MEPYTVTLTSCGRFDLLEQTLRSLLPRLDGPAEAILISEDSADHGIHEVLEQFRSNLVPMILAVVNDPPIGQIASIDNLYQLVDTDWVFHCEDDWEFFGAGFIESSFALLMEHSEFSMVGLRDASEYGVSAFGPEQVDPQTRVRHRIADGSSRWQGQYSGIHFNPGLRRMSDYRSVGPYGTLGRDVREVTVSEAYRDLGYRVAILAEPAVRHIGHGRHVRDSFQRPGFWYRKKRSARKRWLKLRDRLESGRTGP